jgi:hypothetical protein
VSSRAQAGAGKDLASGKLGKRDCHDALCRQKPPGSRACAAHRGWPGVASCGEKASTVGTAVFCCRLHIYDVVEVVPVVPNLHRAARATATTTCATQIKAPRPPRPEPFIPLPHNNTPSHSIPPPHICLQLCSRSIDTPYHIPEGISSPCPQKQSTAPST